MRIETILLVAALGLGASLAQAQSSANPAEGKVAINYSRCDGKYEGWGLHTWKNPGIPLPGVEWANPLKPSGSSEFGVYWLTDLAGYGKSGSVNYIIHLGDTKENGGRDMKFDGKSVKEIWVIDGDRRFFTSLAEAKAARAEKPCTP
ncbi:MAG: pullulanase-associated domain-containing protein [Rhodoferax sp.]